MEASSSKCLLVIKLLLSLIVIVFVSVCYCFCLVFFFTVARSKCPSYIGLTGIVVQETQGTFKLVTRDDCVKSRLLVYQLFKGGWGSHKVGRVRGSSL